MADFIMTLDSDDDSFAAPPQPKSKASSSASKKPTPASAPATQPKKLSKKQRQKQKRLDMDDFGPQADSDDDGNAMGHASDQDEGVAKMDTAFVFDGLGGGFIGDRRNTVWDSGEAYLQKRPNAMPRVTVDEIIARRAPERAAAQAAAEAQALLDEDDDELEAEMMRELEDGGELEALGRSDGEDGLDSDEEGDDDAEETEGNGGEAEEKGEQSGDASDEENWLGIGKASDGEEDEDEDGGEKGEASGAEDDEEAVKAGPSGFAALADFDDDMSDALSASSDAEDDNKDASVPASDAALAKSFFTAHRNAASTSSSKALSFTSLPNATLSRQLLLALGSLNLSTPTPIQAECIPLAMMGKDIVASSATGSGKTVAFWVGVLERLLHRDRKNPMTRVVVMTPTRELAVQVHGVGKALARYTDVQFCLCVGGLSLKVQEAELKQRPDVVVSTPGRLIDHVRNTPCFTMDGVEVLVLDEADRMLEEGFRAELEEIITAAPRSRQTLLFSATVTESVSQLTRLSMNKPVRVKIDEMGAAAKGLDQECASFLPLSLPFLPGTGPSTEGGLPLATVLRVRGDKAGESIELNSRSGERHREALLIALCTRSFASGRTIIFFRSKAAAHRMKILFSLYGQGLERSDELHGDLTQEQRLASLKKFREGEIAFLLATDLASRGEVGTETDGLRGGGRRLDIKGIENVINYEMPKSFEIYLHRVGRTARAGKKGRFVLHLQFPLPAFVLVLTDHVLASRHSALTLVGESDRKLVKLAMKHAPPESIKQRTVPSDVVAAVFKELKEMEREVKEVMREEKEEKEIRRGNMELQKATNLLQHEAEIKARPARTWFQTETEKSTAKNLGTAEHNAKFSAKQKRPFEEEEEALSKPPKRTPFSGLSRRDKRRKMAAREEEEDRDDGTARSIGASIRSAKKAALPRKTTFARPERPEGAPGLQKKKGRKNAFEKEMGVRGGAEKEKREGKRERALSRGEDVEGKVKNRLGKMGPRQKRK
ncbi:SPOSA6832_00245 [Sporobolomyces salmonicolor]|uniref:RNA helicase n=1 Tax=Sporidiobolus salmonicolor TaxID=5005 RepID=A0A0D6EGB2_SPOSA|nr:SPOSA6832_00245 [Sporobolomyces salmonicolor]